MPDRFEPRPQRGHRGPYVYLTSDEIKEVIALIGTERFLNKTLQGLLDRCLNAQDPVYENMKKPL